MSSSIDIPAQSKRQSKAHSPMSSSSSTYSTSPTTPAKSSNSAQKQKMVHERRPSLLSELSILPNTLKSRNDCPSIGLVHKRWHRALSLPTAAPCHVIRGSFTVG